MSVRIGLLEGMIMQRQKRRFEARWSCLALVFVAIMVGCTPDESGRTRSGEKTSSRTQAMTSQNSLSTNGLWENGFWENGFWENGFWENGFWENGFWENGFWENGFWENGFWENGFWENGLWENGFWENGLPSETLRSSQYSRQLLHYVYSCAMPATTHDTVLDPNNGTLECGPAGACDAGYECSANNKCVVPLKGAIGLGINRDGSAWWESGKCDESCQRWVSACVLARTNAYGVPVGISMRAPAGAPQRIKDALATTPQEVSDFCLREGAFYGNIFATTPMNGAPPGFTGPADGPIMSTPSYYACAGPGSNIPEITKRFCSSQGDRVVINVPGVCVATPTQAGVCDGFDSAGSIYGCSTSTGATSTHYDEVITVYLKAPIAVCGNAVCEPPTADPSCPSQAGENDTNCPSDCHPGTWAKDYPPSFGFGSSVDLSASRWQFVEEGMSAVAPDDSIVVVATTSNDIDLGGGMLPASQGLGVLAKYNPDGTHAWSFRVQPSQPTVSYFVNGVAVAPSGNITVIGFAVMESAGSRHNTMWMNTYTASGDPVVASFPIREALTVPVDQIPPRQLLTTRLLTADALGYIFITGIYTGGIHFSSAHTFEGSGIFLVKVSPYGDTAWWQYRTGSEASGFPLSVVVDSADNVVWLTATGLSKFFAGDRTLGGSMPLWTKNVPGTNSVFTVASVDASGNVYAAGKFRSGNDFGGGPVNFGTGGLAPFIVKYGPDGSFQWVSHATPICPPNRTDCQPPGQGVEGVSIGFDPNGDVILGSFGNPVIGGGIDFGVGTFSTYSSNNIFLAAYTPDTGQPRWAKQVPTVLSSSLLGMAIDRAGRVVVSGAYSGSMQVFDRLLVTGVPEQPGVINSFLASFGTPSPLDLTAPEIGAATTETGSPIYTVPADIVARATSADGADVFFMPPTAIDSGNAGTSVACFPPPNTTFPIGTTTVTCGASDPLGNHSSASFTVTVFDKTGPVFTRLPAQVSAEATVPAGATATFSAPIATDQVDGDRPVTCSPPSGSTFAVGETKVTCTSSDARGNVSSASFIVTVKARDITPPALTLPSTITATATSASGAMVNYSAAATDDFDGPITPVCAPPSGTTFPLGITTVECTATDTFGNQAAGSFQIKVEYAWSGILQPINADGSSVFKLGSTVPVKFRLAGASVGIANAVATLTLAKVSGAVTGTEIEAISTSAATTGNLFRYDGGQYVFNLATRDLSKGTWRLSIDLHDGVLRTVLISFK